MKHFVPASSEKGGILSHFSFPAIKNFIISWHFYCSSLSVPVRNKLFSVRVWLSFDDHFLWNKEGSNE